MASFNIKRFDPSNPTGAASATNADENLSLLAEKIKQRQLRKRNATTAQLDQPTPSTPLAPAPAPAAPVSTAAPVAEWQPPPGESPAEREKRIKREKRALQLGDPLPSSSSSAPAPFARAPAPALSTEVIDGWQPAAGESPAEREKRIKREKRNQRMGVAFDLTPAPPSGSGWSGNRDQDAAMEDGEGGAGVGLSIHPSRLAAAPLLAKEVKEKGPPKEKTTAKKKYLKKKKIRAKGRKAGTAAAGGGSVDGEDVRSVESSKKGKRKRDDDSEDDESESGSESEDGEEDQEKKREEILRKKAERKVKRDAKKAELKRLKALGIALTADNAPSTSTPKPSTTSKSAPTTTVVAPPTPTLTFEEQEALEKEEEVKQARKEAKRLKRFTRRQASPSPPPTSPSKPLAAEDNGDESSFLISTQPGTSPSLLPSELDSLSTSNTLTTTTNVEEAPLVRLPSSRAPLPPSAKTLSFLNVHQSVRNKLVVDPEKKVKLDDESLGISEKGKKKLEAMGVEELFAVQTEVLPLLLATPTLDSPFEPSRDLCVSAPTGSGKTLSYVVPIVEVLSQRIVTRLRGLVLLPTNDLVPQVRKTFESYAKGTGLLIGTATGQHSFAQEQSALVGEGLSGSVEGGVSRVDILIATPGRLMDHLRSTKGFSLQHLRFLVIDEADRLLNQSFHDWLPSILAALNPSSSAVPPPTSESSLHSDALAPQWWESKVSRIKTDFDEKLHSSCQKLLFSATLSRDPAKIDALDLYKPIFVSVEDELDGEVVGGDDGVDGELKFTIPNTLQEFMITSPSTHKPLYLFHLLHSLSASTFSILCFTKSVEAATRLAKLVEFFEEAFFASNPADKKKVVVNTYSSDLPANERTRIMNNFRKGEIQMLICSDLIARGIDLPDVSHVISYDVPTDMRRYVHRVGRTARAGKTGEAWSLIEDPEVAPFREIMKSAQHWEKIKRVRVKDSEVEGFVPHYQTALDKLKVFFASGREKEELLSASR